MDLNEIRKKWNLKQKNQQASIDMWDSMADSFGDYDLPDFKEDTFLQILSGQNMLKPQGLVLDVGCGAGKYSLAVAKHCGHVIGMDLSPKMIDIAQQKAVQHNIANVEFYCEDWHQLDIGKAGYLGKFDLVFAHMTPAIQSAETFEKLSAVSHDWCVMAKHIHRTDPVSDAVKKMVGIKEKRESADKDILFAFSLLWQQGYLPRLEYAKRNWQMKKTLDEAYGLYVNRVRTYKDITAQQEEQIKSYIASLVSEGFVYEEVNTTIAYLYWQVR